MASGRKNKGGGVLIGPILVVVGLAALWKNETRFDYHKAAAKTEFANTLNAMEPGQNVSYSGEMDQALELQGAYIAKFTGYLLVNRSAEIYCWDRDEDDDGDVTWSKRWMKSVESNSRNSGIRQELEAGRILPPSFEVGELSVSAKKIEFVDSRVEVAPGPLPKTEAGERLRVEGEFLMLRKGRSSNLGDERLSFRAIPVPVTATWFGRFEGNEGVADISEQRTGILDSVIQNTGVLHHLVAGERDVALKTMKRHIQRVKWIVRGIGTAVIIFGLLFLFSSLLRFLHAIPLLGPLAEAGSFLLALAIGIPLAVTTIAIGFVTAQPLLLIPIVGGVLAVVWLLVRATRRQQKKSASVKQQLDSEFGRTLEDSEMKQMEYREMAGMLASRGGTIGASEARALDRYAKRSGIKPEERKVLLEEVQQHPPVGESAESHLRNLIRLAVADAKLTPQEVRSIREAATVAGYDRKQFRELMAGVSEMASAQAAT